MTPKLTTNATRLLKLFGQSAAISPRDVAPCMRQFHQLEKAGLIVWNDGTSSWLLTNTGRVILGEVK